MTVRRFAYPPLKDDLYTWASADRGKWGQVIPWKNG